MRLPAGIKSSVSKENNNIYEDLISSFNKEEHYLDIKMNNET